MNHLETLLVQRIQKAPVKPWAPVSLIGTYFVIEDLRNEAKE